MTDPGNYDVRLQVQTDRTGQSDEFGQPLKGWHTRYSVWAQVKPLVATGRQFIAAQQTKGDATHEIRTHYVADISVRDRFVDHRGIVYDAVSVADVTGRREELTILAKAVQ